MTTSSSKARRGRLRPGARTLTAIATAALLTASSAVGAETFYCEDTRGVSLDQFGIATSNDEAGELGRQRWVVDTDKGWRRADLEGFSGTCETNKGYVVCRATDIVFGEATFSIHPDGVNYVLVFVDYGLNALAYVGRCSSDAG